MDISVLFPPHRSSLPVPQCSGRGCLGRQCDLHRLCPLLSLKLQLQWQTRLYLAALYALTRHWQKNCLWFMVLEPHLLICVQQLHLPKPPSPLPYKCVFQLPVFHLWLSLTGASAPVFPTHAVLSPFIFCRFCLQSWKGRMNSLLSKLWKRTWC